MSWVLAVSATMTVLTAGTAAMANDGIHIVRLQKQLVPVKRGDKTVSHKTAYFGAVNVGEPIRQSMTVVFDTGSGHFIIPSVACDSATCRQHRRYDREASTSAVDIDRDGVVVDANDEERDQVGIAFGTGSVSGEFAYENVCLGEGDGPTAEREDCVRLRMVLATDMTEDPFSLFSFDGVLGLGLDALTLDPEFSFFGQMTRAGRLREPVFGVYLAREDADDSEISFGGLSDTRFSTAPRWAPVARPELGYWQVRIRSLSVGDKPLGLCKAGDCHAILDTGSSILGVPSEVVPSLHWSLARKVDSEQATNTDCRHFRGPPIVFDLGDFNITLDVEDYSRPAPMLVHSKKPPYRAQTFCRAQLLPVEPTAALGSKVFIWGEPMLRKYATAYRWDQQRIGFALAAHPSLPLESFEDELGMSSISV